MSKAVMISIQPQWVEKILNGEKTIEVRKTAPKLETPFKVYIYCTKPKGKVCCGGMGLDDELYKGETGKVGFAEVSSRDFDDFLGNELYLLNGKVVAEFTCDRIGFVLNEYCNDSLWFEICEGTCLTSSEIADYMGYSAGCYRWHISNLKIYDKPRMLGEFRKACIQGSIRERHCMACQYGAVAYIKDRTVQMTCNNFITRPPQSWGYIEETE